MGARKRSGSDDRSNDRGPGHLEQLPGRLDDKRSATDRAEQAIADMVANGATFTPQSRTDGLKGFTYEVAGHGDRMRCRSILDGVRGDVAIWTAVLDILCATPIQGGAHG